MIEEYSVHGFTYVIISPEWKWKIADTATDMCSRQIFTNPSRCIDKVNGIVIMLFYACSNGKHIGIKNYVLWIKTDFVHEKMISTLTNLYFTGRGVSLPFLVECHYHDCRTILFYLTGMSQERFFSFFQGDGIHDGFPLQAFQSSFNDFPFGRVDHDGHTGDIRLGSNQIKESRHFLTGIQQAIIHIYIND